MKLIETKNDREMIERYRDEGCLDHIQIADSDGVAEKGISQYSVKWKIITLKNGDTIDAVKSPSAENWRLYKREGVK